MLKFILMRTAQFISVRNQKVKNKLQKLSEITNKTNYKNHPKKPTKTNYKTHYIIKFYNRQQHFF